MTPTSWKTLDALGEAIAKAGGRQEGDHRYGNFYLPMDESLSLWRSIYPTALFRLESEVDQAGDRKFDGLLLEHFFESVAASARINLTWRSNTENSPTTSPKACSKSRARSPSGEPRRSHARRSFHQRQALTKQESKRA